MPIIENTVDVYYDVGVRTAVKTLRILQQQQEQEQ